MEFKLPFPTLQDLAVLEIVHSLTNHSLRNMELTRDSLCESLSKVDKLEILEQQKCRIREVMKDTHDYLRYWFMSHKLTLNKYNATPKLQFDVYGHVNEVRMARDFLLKCHSDQRCDSDLWALTHLLYVASDYALLPEISEILLKIIKLRTGDSAVPQLDGPKFEFNTDKKLCLEYKFVDTLGMPMSLNVDYFAKVHAFSAVCVSNSGVRITLNRVFYDSEFLQLHWNLLEPSKRITFLENMINMSSNFFRQVVSILYFLTSLDPDSRHGVVDAIDSKFDNYEILFKLLIWPNQVFFLPALQLVRSRRELKHYQLISFFKIMVSKADMFQEILLPFWEAVSSEFELCSFFEAGFNNVLKELSQKNVSLYKRVSTDLKLPLCYLQESRKRKHNESLSSMFTDSHV